MKKIFVLLNLLWCCYVQGTWKLGTVINNSDLTLDAAYYISPKEKEITVLTEKIKQQSASGQQNILIDYTVSDTSNGVSILRAYRQIGNKKEYYSLELDGKPAHALYRAKAKKGKHHAKAKKDKRNKPFICKDLCTYGNYCARIFLDHDMGAQLHEQVACAGAAYESEGSVFDIVINRSGNRYVVELQQPVVVN